MKWPIDAAILMVANLDERDYVSIISLLNHIARKLQLSTVDREQLSMAVRIVKNRPAFLDETTLASVKATFLHTEEGQKFNQAFIEARKEANP